MIICKLDIHMKLLTGMARLVGATAASLSVEWDGPCPALMGTLIKLSILNPPNNPEFPNRTVGARACATNTA